jgi:hypothetical protein
MTERAHKVTTDEGSEPINGSITVQTGGETKTYDIKLAKGQVTLPLTSATYRVDIEPIETRHPKTQNKKGNNARGSGTQWHPQQRCSTIYLSGPTGVVPEVGCRA